MRALDHGLLPPGDVYVVYLELVAVPLLAVIFLGSWAVGEAGPVEKFFSA
ncbi:hypothetical protein ACIQMV_25080 [Streptomyces sp. NPDC091412]